MLGNVKLTSTWFGQVFKVDYIMKVYVKHASLTEFGEGQFINVPIRIKGVPLWT